ncbi:ABC transporter [Lampropedia cohaerens]|uniref:ABC transporter n=1 Tax=Lampropedia cohaerens TaxID=1610491 RepID=A0A0U1Q2S2_9BURK|nr:ABC transporter [Lampropedia cohaerens]
MRLEQLCVDLGAHRAIAHADVALRRGRWTSIVGPNGAGKSTLLKAMAGLLPVQGQVLLLDQPLTAMSARQRARTVAWLGQQEPVLDTLTAYDTVMLGRLPYQSWLAMPSATDVQAVRAAMQACHVWQLRARTLTQLSGGERQRVLLARVLAVQAPVVLMDEPLAGLDPPHQTQWLLDMRAQVAAGTTLVTVLHEISMALQADDLLVLRHGRIVHHGPCGHVATRRAVEAVFEHRIAICQVQGQWTSIARLPGAEVHADAANQ